MSEQYLRRASLRVADKTGQAKDFNGLRTTFKIEKTEESNANKAKIDVYNLSKQSRTFMEGTDLKVFLNVGYLGVKQDTVLPTAFDLLEAVFIGNVSQNDQGRTFSKHDGPDWVTTIECGDGEKELQTANVNSAFAAGTPFQAVITQVVQSLGLTVGSIAPVGNGIATSGFSMSGKAKDVLDKLAARFGFSWSVQDGAVQITTPTTTTPELAVVITPKTGLIGNVIKRSEGGIEFNCLLNPLLKPGRAVSIVGSADVTGGFYKVTRVVHDGDTHGGNWLSQVEAKSLL